MSPSIPPFDEYEARRCCRGPHDAFKWMLKMQTAPEDTAAIIIEPILGEGGFVAPPPDFLSTIRKHCDEHNIVMIMDEVLHHLLYQTLSCWQCTRTSTCFDNHAVTERVKQQFCYFLLSWLTTQHMRT